MNGPNPFNWFQVDRRLVDERSADVRKEINKLLAKGPTLSEEEQIAELAEELFKIYRDVCALQGFSESPILIGTVYGKISQEFSIRISSLISQFRAVHKRSGGLRDTRGKQLALKATKQRLASMLRRKAGTRKRELSYGRQPAISISPAPQSGKIRERSAPVRNDHLNLEFGDPPGGSNQAAFGLSPEDTSRASRTTESHKASMENVGRRRAADIVKAGEEIAEVRDQLQCDSDYPLLKAKYPAFMLFKVCDREPELKELLLGIQGHHQKRAKRFAKQVAAAHNRIKLNTIEKAWDLYNPEKKNRKPSNKPKPAKRPAKPRGRRSR